MKNYEKLLTETRQRTQGDDPLVNMLEDYVIDLKAQLLSFEQKSVRDLVDASFIGYPKLTTISANRAADSSALIAWMAANCYYLDDKDSITYFSDQPETVIDRFSTLVVDASAINVVKELPSRENLWSIMRTSSLVVIDQPQAITSPAKAQALYQLVKESYFHNVKQRCRGILISANAPANKLPWQPVIINTDVMLCVDLQPSDPTVAPFIKTTKNRWSADFPNFYQLPIEIANNTAENQDEDN